VAFIVVGYCVVGTESVRPESAFEMRRLAVTGSSVFEDLNSAPSDAPPGGHEVHSSASPENSLAVPPSIPGTPEGSSNPDVTSCEMHFLTPSNWGLSLHLGREAKGGLVATAAEKGATLGIVKIARAFRSSPAIVDNDQKGLYLRPALDVWTPHWIFTKFGCKFDGEVKLSLNETCEDGAATRSVTQSSKGNNGESTAFRLSAPSRLLVAARENTSEVLLNQACDMQLYFCVKPSKHWEWHSLTMLWYFRDADGKSAMALNPEENRIPHMFRGWTYASGLMFSDPLADEKGVATCTETRWNRFLELQQEMEKIAADSKSDQKEMEKFAADSGTDNKAENTEANTKRAADLEKELQKAANEAVAGTPCEERNPKGMRPHSAIVMEFARSKSRPQAGKTSAIVGGRGIAPHGATPGSKKTMHA